MLLDFLQFIARVWTYVTSSIITIMVQDTMVSCFDDCGYLLVDLLASTLTHSQYTLYIAARVILLKHNINHAVHMLCSKFSSLPISLRTTAKVLTTTYLDSVLKAETSLCQESIVQAMVFPVVMYICESWTIKKAEHWRIDAFKLWCCRRLLRVPWTARRSNQSILKEIRPDYSLEGLMLKLKFQYFGHLTWRASSLEKTLILGKIEGRRRSGWQRMKWLIGIIDSMDVSLSKLQEIVKGREAWHAADHGVTKSQTWLSSWTTWQKWY